MSSVRCRNGGLEQSRRIFKTCSELQQGQERGIHGKEEVRYQTSGALQMIIGGIQKTSTIDFPGILSCVIFTRGCDLNCFYCHNRNLLYHFGESLDDDSVWSFLHKRKGLLDGVVISGGEPTLQNDLTEFITSVKELGYKVKLDTNGLHPGKVEELCKKKLLDYVAVDVKASLEDYTSVCGVDGFFKMSQTLDILSESGVSFEVRTTLYPGLDIDGLKKIFSSLPVMPRWRLNYFRMPEQYLFEDEERLGEIALTPSDIKNNIKELQKLQPKILFE